MTQRVLQFLWLTVFSLSLSGQVQIDGVVDIKKGIDYEIGGIEVVGATNLDPNMVALLSGLSIGDMVQFPSDKVAESVKNLWKQDLFSDVQLYVTRQVGNMVFIEYRLKTLPKLSKYYFTGIKQNRQDAIREKLELNRGMVVSENLRVNTANRIRSYFIDKGFIDVEVEVRTFRDTNYSNAVIMHMDIQTNDRVRIAEIEFEGNEAINSSKLRRAMKGTHRYRWYTFFQSSKLKEDELQEDRRKLVELYNENGYRDARIVSDSMYRDVDSNLVLKFEIDEGTMYYWRSVKFYGNSKYDTDMLERMLQIKAGDPYNSLELAKRVGGDPNGNDIASLYLNNGYLFSNVQPVEVRVENDSIDLEIRIREGRQATISKVSITGNDRTNDHVVYREIRTKPGDLFSKADIMRTIRELGQLGYFDPRQIQLSPPSPDPLTGTVALEYTLVEQSTSQLELQGGWGANMVIGTAGLNFNNFSARNLFNKSAWRPLPSGDGQTINIRAQSNGSWYSSYNFSFTEPWLGGKKPNSVTFSAYKNMMSYNGRTDSTAQKIDITGVVLGQGLRLKWPDDWFTLYHSLEYRRFDVNDYPLAGGAFTEGVANSFAYSFNLKRDNRDYPIFPTRGSSVSFTFEGTPPFSLIDGRDYSKLTDQEKFSFIEYHKWKFSGDFYAQVIKNFVVRGYGEFGFLGAYNPDYGLPPFERFHMGGDGMQNFVLDGREIIGLRGYANLTLTPQSGGALYNKFTAEARYLLSPNPNAQIFVLGFAEAGNNYDAFRDYRPYELKRSAGMGLRIFMPAFGLLGVDLGYGFDPLPNSTGASGWQTHFVLGQQF